MIRGVAGARAYLKQMDQGLKHFLANYQTEFVIEGNKGCEYVAYVPTPASCSGWWRVSEVSSATPVIPWAAVMFLGLQSPI
eukprot:s3007_g5.t1